MNLEEQLSAVLSDPEAMNKISSIMGALGAPSQDQSQSQQPQPAPQLPSLSGLKLPDMAGDNRTKLLMALKPFLSQKRAPYVDGAVALLGMMQLGKLSGAMEPLISAFNGKNGQ